MSGRAGGASSDKPAKDDKGGQNRPAPAVPRPEDDEEDGDIATPKRDRDDEDI